MSQDFKTDWPENRCSGAGDSRRSSFSGVPRYARAGTERGRAARGVPQSAATVQAAPPSAQGAAPTTQQAPAEAAEAPQVLHLMVGRSLVITSPTRIRRISVADPTIADAIVVNPNQVLVNGKAPGGVSLLLWDDSDQTPGV